MKMNKRIGLVLFACLCLTAFSACGGSAPTAQPPANPAETPPETAQPATETEAWKQELERVYEEAKKEGEVAVIAGTGSDREQLFKEFEEAYPGVKVNHIALNNNAASARIVSEQQQGKYLIDVSIETTRGEYNKLKDYIIDPGITDDQNWRNGFEYGFKTQEGTIYADRYIYAIEPYPIIYINNDFIPAGEIQTMDDLLDPKWQGKAVAKDFSVNGQGTNILVALSLTNSMEFVDQLLANLNPTISSDDRQNIQWFASGRYPIAIGLNKTQINEFEDNGVIKNIQRLRFDQTRFYGSFSLAVLKDAPHPNATKLFVNWLLSKEGQEAFARNFDCCNSRRTDVPEPTSPDSFRWEQIDYANGTANISQKGLDTTAEIIEKGKQFKK